jgi:hypothetical protein
MSGYISVRDPIEPFAFQINHLGVHYGILKATDIILLDMNTGKILDGWLHFCEPWTFNRRLDGRRDSISLPSYGNKRTSSALG